MKVLIVEDNWFFRQEMISLIKNEADEIYQCDDGIYAESLYEKHKPDIIFMDIHMKQMNGLEATKNLTEKYPDARIIIVTNYSDKVMKDRAKECGAEGYLIKDNISQIKEFITRK